VSFLRRKSQGDSTLIFFATDIHGSEVCFRKFINAAAHFGAKVLIMGGDLTGKMLVPLVRNGSGRVADFGGRTYHLTTDAEIAAFSRSVRDSGAYVYACEEDELAHYEEQNAIEELIARVAVDSVREWVALAEDRLGGSDIQCLMAPGNDDMLGVDEALAESTVILNPDGKRIDLKSGHQLIATGYSNITPWRTDRELGEDELSTLLDGLFEKVDEPASAIACLHVPPYGSGLDLAPRLDANLRMQTIGGEPEMIPVGSTAVTESIEKHQPLLALHGHIHESHGRMNLGRTVCLNPGSTYSDGALKAALITLTKDSVRAVRFIDG
jgi:Icc-related predicted phosphoesterase